MAEARTRLAILGDVMLGRLVNDHIGSHSPAWFWGTTLGLLESADTVLANLESAITRHRRPWVRTPKAFHFRADPPAMDVLKAGNIRFVSLANNHVLDFEVPGLLDTIAHLDDAGIQHGGAGVNEAEARAPALVQVGPLTVGIIALTDNEPDFAATTDRPGTFYGAIGDDDTLVDTLRSMAAGLRRRGADFVVLSAHWGPNMVTRPPARFQAFARALTDDGTIDLFWGHSAHIFQAVEQRDNALILYDTGDYLDDYQRDPVLRNDWSFLFLVDFVDRQIDRLTMVPVVLDLAQVNLATGLVAEAICARMEDLCTPLGTAIERCPTGSELRVRP